jgi:hypothetical protein
VLDLACVLVRAPALVPALVPVLVPVLVSVLVLSPPAGVVRIVCCSCLPGLKLSVCASTSTSTAAVCIVFVPVCFCAVPSLLAISAAVSSISSPMEAPRLLRDSSRFFS